MFFKRAEQTSCEVDILWKYMLLVGHLLKQGLCGSMINYCWYPFKRVPLKERLV